jgi:CMP-N,N'-diacetyllegionaminic acid synthase
MKNIAIIPARSGSKGVIDKNIKELNGKPLIAYSIEAAINSGCFDTVMVSTDSEYYANLSRTFCADVPFLRSAATSSDSASSWDAVIEVISNYEELGMLFDTFCLLQPTSPLRTAEDIISAYEVFTSHDASVVVSMTELEHPLSWCGTIENDNSIENFTPLEQMGRRQLQIKYYRPNGAVYVQNTRDFMKNQYLYRKGSYAYIMPKERSLDIDTDEDFRYAEFLLKGR